MVNDNGFSHRFKKNKGDTVFDLILYFLIILITIVMLYPFLYMLSCSLSNAKDMTTVTFYPKGFTLLYYRFVFSLPSVKTGYMNSVLYTALGTLIGMFLTICCAYPLSKKWLPGRRLITIFIVITMYFSGGLIPYFLVVKTLGLYGNMGAIVIPGALATFYVIILVTSFKGIPLELDEASYMDGAGEIVKLVKIYLPMSKPILATLILFYSVAQWNSWFPASIFLNDKAKFPIQLMLRNAMASMSSGSLGGGFDRGEMAVVLKSITLQNTDVYSLNYALTIAVILPIIFVYPFVQRYFVKGVMIGSLKG